MENNGYIHVYMGDGKGKTTCALGLAFRSIGAGFKVMMVQFLKNWHTSELDSIKLLGDKFEIFRIESKKDFTYNLNEEELKLLREEIKIELNKAKEFINSGNYDLIILDEVLGAIQGGFIDEFEIIEIMKNKPKNLELILTGRNASKDIIDNADLVSRIDKVKHYYDNGILARVGIEY
ncbi:cob(I)yrinic acid a,c-diamide adenosyltransferase [Candidatus Arthromitus sp. SFB-rat-Yit]|uniref:cob(I)yrinic acid a,c-diamide adenosyltransferase n=1 Tax=Candidatus Arthromitus sp. SFB-rat-Yit TaxID=1041504 RepID=UPI0002E87D93